jgi:hypothetical protein
VKTICSALVALLLASQLSGCGGARAAGSGPGGPGLGPQAAVARANATHEYPAPAPAPQRAPGALSAIGAVTGFARRYINWGPQDVSATMSQLARASVGQARSEMALAAAETRGDTTLQQGGIANRGSVEAVAPLRGRPGSFVVVTRESTVASQTNAYQGLAAAWHVTVATVLAVGKGPDRRWVISGWQPEN